MTDRPTPDTSDDVLGAIGSIGEDEWGTPDDLVVGGVGTHRGGLEEFGRDAFDDLLHDLPEQRGFGSFVQ